MKALPLAAAALLAACASTEAGMGANAETGATSAAGSMNAGGGIDGLAIRFFRCDNNAAFTAQNYQNRAVRVTVRDGTRYDLQQGANGFSDGTVTYTRDGNAATLTGAAGGPYTNCTTG